MTAISLRSRHTRIAAGLLLLSTAAGATAVAVGPAAASPGPSAAVTHLADQPNPTDAPGNTVWD